MAKLFNKALILFKKESVYGTDPSPVANTNAILTSIPQLEIIGNAKERAALVPSLGKYSPKNVGEGIKISFDTEFKGQVSINTPPAINHLLQACGLTIIDEGTEQDYTYLPDSNFDGASLTIYFYMDGILHKATGCRGTFKANFVHNEIAVISFEFTGLYSGAHESDTAFPSPTFPSETPNVVQSLQATFNSYSAIMNAIEIDLGNTITKRPSVNAASGVHAYSITGREVKGSIDPEVVPLATFNPWDLYDQSTEATLTFKIGYYTWTISRCVLEPPKYSNRESIAVYNLPFMAHPSTAGNNEISILVVNELP